MIHEYSTSPSTVLGSLPSYSSSAALDSSTFERVPKVAEKRALVNVENAVYAHMRAMRSLGRTTLNVGDIASALKLPVSDVTRAVAALKTKGVKVLA